MKRAVIFAVCLATLACSSGSDRNVNLLQPDLEFIQIMGPADLGYPVGRMEVQYGIRVMNRSSEPITLHSVAIQSVGFGGPYRLQRKTYYFDKKIDPDKFDDVSFWAVAFAEGDPHASDANAPVTIRGVAVFNTATGAMRKVFQKTVGQHGTGPRRGN